MAEIHRPESLLMNGERALPSALSEIGSKRQRRPSVRLGDLGGDPPFDSHIRRSSSTSKQWKSSNLYLSKEKDSSGYGNSHSNHPHPHRSSKTRNVLHFNPPSAETLGLDGDDNLDSFAIGSWKTTESSKKRQPAKKARPNQVSLFPYQGGEPDSDKYSAGEYLDDEEQPGFHMENSDSPLKERTPENSWENLGLAVAVDTGKASYLHRRPSTRTRSRSGDHHHDVSGPSDTDMRDGNGQFREDGVKIWLNGLGLGRYAPVFQIHEVDDEVLPLLTLEDLKDMGISAVGSRRKMYCAIQKLGKGFS